MIVMQPHLPIVDERGRRTNWVALSGPLATEHSRQVHATLVAHERPIVGFTSHAAFPFHQAADAPDYVGMCLGWCSCFRESPAFGRTPVLDLSASDLLNTDWVTPARFGSRADTWDYVYVCLPGAGPERAKNWPLARACISALSAAGFRGLLVGRIVLPDLPDSDAITVRGRVRWDALLHLIADSRALLVTAIHDASPRVMAEALALDRPVIVNCDILGGWKYVTPQTGRFFRDATDVVDAMAACLETATSPRQWFCDSYGRVRAGGRLRGFLSELGDVGNTRYVYLGNVPYVDGGLDA